MDFPAKAAAGTLSEALIWVAARLLPPLATSAHSIVSLGTAGYSAALPSPQAATTALGSDFRVNHV